MDVKTVKDFAENRVKTLEDCIKFTADKDWLEKNAEDFKSKIEAFKEIIKFIDEFEGKK